MQLSKVFEQPPLDSPSSFPRHRVRTSKELGKDKQARKEDVSCFFCLLLIPHLPSQYAAYSVFVSHERRKDGFVHKTTSSSRSCCSQKTLERQSGTSPFLALVTFSLGHHDGNDVTFSSPYNRKVFARVFSVCHKEGKSDLADPGCRRAPLPASALSALYHTISLQEQGGPCLHFCPSFFRSPASGTRQ